MDQAKALASLLAEKLEEDILVKELADSATLVNWLDQFAMLDLALLSAEQVKAHPGRFLLIGPFGAQGELNLVCRQGIPGDLPERAARAVRESGFVPWRSPDAVAPSPPPALEPALPELAPEPPSIEKMIIQAYFSKHHPLNE